MIDVALIGHLESQAEYAALAAEMRGEPTGETAFLSRVLGRLEPAPICDLRTESIRGSVVRSRYIDMFLLVEGTAELAGARRKFAGACALARKTGAKIAALGGFASIVGERAHDLSAEHGLAFTTGNTLTAAVIAAQAKTAVDATATIAVVGAAGDVGSGVCRALDQRGHALILVGRSPKPLEALRSELADARVAALEEALPLSDLVVLVASAGRNVISLDGLRPHAKVLDAGHPRNACSSGPCYARAGRVSHAVLPTCDLPLVLSFEGPPGESHACLAEAIVLAYENRFESYSRGRGSITPARMLEMLAMAAKHGVHPAPLRWEATSR